MGVGSTSRTRCTRRGTRSSIPTGLARGWPRSTSIPSRAEWRSIHASSPTARTSAVCVSIKRDWKGETPRAIPTASWIEDDDRLASAGTTSRAQRIDERSVVAHGNAFLNPGEVLAEEKRRRQLTARTGTGFVEDRFQVIGDGVARDAEPRRDLGGGGAAQDQLRHLLLTAGESVGPGEKRRYERGMRPLYEDRVLTRVR